MTKQKSKKMTKSTFAIIIMAVVMVAMIAFGGTYAFFTATATGTGELTAKTAKIELTSGEIATTAKVVNAHALPGEKVMDVAATLSDSSTRNTYIFAVVTLKLGDTVTTLANAESNEVFDIAWADDSAFTDAKLFANIATNVSGVYVIENTANDAAPTTAEDFKFSLTVSVKDDLDENNHDGQETLEYMGKEVSVTVTFGAIQQAGFTYGTSGEGVTYDYETKELAYKAAYAELYRVATADGQTLDTPVSSGEGA